MQNKAELLMTASPLGAYLTDEQVKRLASCCGVAKFGADGTELFESPFYLVLEGVVSVQDVDTDTELCTRQKGSFFTRKAGQAAGSTRLRTTKLLGKEKGKVMLVTKEDALDTFYASLPSHAREGYDAIVSTNVATVLSSVEFIQQADVDPAHLRHLGELCAYLALPADTMVFEQGDRADCFYIVLKGSAKVGHPPAQPWSWCKRAPLAPSLASAHWYVTLRWCR